MTVNENRKNLSRVRAINQARLRAMGRLRLMEDLSEEQLQAIEEREGMKLSTQARRALEEGRKK